MKKLLLLLLLLIALKGSAQTGDSMPVKPEKINDSLLSTVPAADSLVLSDDIDRNVSSILRMQNDRRAKEKRNAMIRIGIGIAFFIILIIGLRRKTAKK
jgi:amino acid permease